MLADLWATGGWNDFYLGGGGGAPLKFGLINWLCALAGIFILERPNQLVQVAPSSLYFEL